MYNMKSIVLFMLCIVGYSAVGQHRLGIATGNYNTFNSIYLNPANIAEAKEKKAVSLFSFSGGVDNNVGPFDAANGLFVAVGDGKANNMFQYTNNSKVSMMAPYFDVQGPGIMMKIDAKNSIAITSRVRGFNQFHNFDQTLFHTFSDPAYRTDKDITSNQSNFNYTVHLWGELGFSYAKTIYDKGPHKIKVGGTVRYLSGIAYVGVRGNNMDMKFKAGVDSFYAGNVDIDYASNFLYTKSSQGANVSQSFFSLLYKGKFGHGIGGDLGVVYEYKGKSDKPSSRYKTKFFASLNDLGAIYYNASINYTETFSGSGYVTGPGILRNVKNMENLSKYTSPRGVSAEINKASERLGMPTHILFGGDYHVKKQYYANVSFLLNLANRGRLGNSFYNQFTVTPRYETKRVTVGLPITYSTLSNRFKTGIGLSSGGFFVGSDDMLSYFLKSEYGLNFYVGLNVPVNK